MFKCLNKSQYANAYSALKPNVSQMEFNFWFCVEL